MESEADDLRSSINKLPDNELSRIVGEDRSEYRPEAIAYAREEMARRNLDIPEEAGAIIPSGGAQSGPTSELEKGIAFSGLSLLSKALFVAAGSYVVYGRLVNRKTGHYSGALGIALLSTMIWSLAWDVRMKSSISEEGAPMEPKWPRRLVILAGVFTAIAVILACWELYTWRR